MHSRSHIIKRQCIEIDLPPETLNGHEVQSEVAGLFWNRLLPAMEEVFDRLSPDDRVIRIDRLEIDAGEMNYNQLLTDLTEKVPVQLYDKITELLIQHNSLRHIKDSESFPDGITDGKVRVLLIEDSQIEALAYFLRTGHMPWTTGTKAGKEDFVQLLLKLTESHIGRTAAMLQNELKNTRHLQRFIFQVPDETLFQILPLYAAKGIESSSQYLVIRKLAGFSRSMSEALRKTERISTLAWNEFRLLIWSRLTEIVFMNPGRIRTSKTWLREQIMNILRQATGETVSRGKSGDKTGGLSELADRILELPESDKESFNNNMVKEVEAFLKEKSVKPLFDKDKSGQDEEQDGPGAASPGQSDRSLPEGPSVPSSRSLPEVRSVPSARDADPGKPSSRQRSAIDFSGDGTEDGLPGEEANISSSRRRPGSSESTSPPISVPENNGREIRGASGLIQNATEVLVGNAGIVILHPFLKSFFEKLNFVKGKEFVSHEARHRAVHLIQYLATGHNETGEEELFLNKIMCGLSPETPVIKGIDIRDKERAECEQLLEHVISQWSVLKKSSPDSIRSAFLSREGLITGDGYGGSWKLTVERKSLDVLVDRLPWLISIIKLPWNPYLIYVEW